ncbi:MAG TPA: glycosyltransferase [bacterium]|nr:glycosyltransferase [bacterium]
MKKILIPFDFLTSLIIIFSGVLFSLPLIITGRIFKLFRLRKFYKRHRFIWLPSASYQTGLNKGGRWGVLPYHTTFDGYFEKNFIIHLIGDKYLKVQVDKDVYVIDYPIFLKKIMSAGIFKYSILSMNVVLLNLYMSVFIFKNKIDLIGSGSPYFIGVNTAIFSFITGCPYYWGPGCNYDLDIELNGLPKYIPSKKVAMLCIKIATKFAFKLNSIRQDLKDYLVKKGTPADRITVIYNAVDLELYKKKPDYSKLEEFKNNFKIVYAGRINRVNVIHHIIECANLTYKKIPNAKFLILGGGLSGDDKKYFEECRELIKKYNIEKYVYMPGIFISNFEVANYKLCCDINLITMGGLSLIESAASGKPVIVYDYDWHSELIENRKTGLLVKYNDFQQMADCIFELYSNLELGKILAENAYNRILERHTFEKEKENLIRFYESIYAEI